MQKCLIVAVAQDGGIGAKGDLPWHISEDLKYFKAQTSGYPVIMGRTTYNSLPFRPLKGRLNIVLSRKGEPIEGTTVVGDLESAYRVAEDSGAQKCFVMGGASVYKAAMSDMDLLYVTEVHTVVREADVFFPEIDPQMWNIISKSETHTDPETGFEFEFVVYERKLRE